jgi:4-amino-4-deoxy-L-arabinose transferase-like glycosyltransferase
VTDSSNALAGVPATSSLPPRVRQYADHAKAANTRMALSGRYGFHGDELYFLDSARHLQGGYVDQPILVPLLARVSLSLFGVSLPGLRVWAALAVAATVVIGGLLARELGGRRNAQLLAALATATMPAVIGTGDILEPTTLDVLFWAALAATGCWAAWSWGSGWPTSTASASLPWRSSSVLCSAGDGG